MVGSTGALRGVGVLLAVVASTLAGLVAPAHAAPAPTTAQGWTGLFQARNDLTWSGSDQAASVKASNGAVYWLFGDTFLGTENATTGAYNPGWRMIANVILVQRGNAITPATAAGRPAIPDVPNPYDTPAKGDELDKYWGVAAVEHAGYLNVFAQRVRITPGQGLGFDLVGAEIARFQFSGDKLVFKGMVPTPSAGLNQKDAPQWGGAALVSGGYAYMYGHKLTREPFDPHSSYLARVPVGSLATPAAWRFWDGSGWASDQSSVVKVFDSQVSSVAIIKGKWTVLAKPWNGSGSEVRALTAAAPSGPFSSRVIFSSPGGTTPQGRRYVTYCPQLHPEQPLASGKTLVSIAWAGEDFWRDTVQDADLYKPRFHEVAF